MGRRNELTIISAITRGCLNGFRMKARPLVTTNTRHICKMTRGSVNWRGSSPWNIPFDVGFIGDGHISPAVALETISL